MILRDAGIWDEFPRLTEAFSSVFSEADPLGLLAMGAPLDEYEPEIETVLHRMPEVGSTSETQEMVHQEFVRWFNSDIAGSSDRFADLSASLWNVWSEWPDDERSRLEEYVRTRRERLGL